MPSLRLTDWQLHAARGLQGPAAHLWRLRQQLVPDARVLAGVKLQPEACQACGQEQRSAAQEVASLPRRQRQRMRRRKQHRKESTRRARCLPARPAAPGRCARTCGEGLAVGQPPAPQVCVLYVLEQLLLLRGEPLWPEKVVAAKGRARRDGWRYHQRLRGCPPANPHPRTPGPPPARPWSRSRRQRRPLAPLPRLYAAACPPPPAHLTVAPLRSMSKWTSSPGSPSASCGSHSSACAFGKAGGGSRVGGLSIRC